MKSMFEPSQAFLKNFISSRGADDLVAGVQKLPRSNYPAGKGPNRIPSADDYGPGRAGSYGLPRGSYQFMDDEFPNPFGGGGGPYMPGAMMPGANSNLMAGVQKLPRSNYPAGRGPNTIPGVDDYGPSREGSYGLPRGSYQFMDDEFPNPFGGGSAPYVRGV